jgi:mRNA-degrading endonuclease RelE of RelBE toxin-antitoxin system
LHTVIETPSFLHDARALGLRENERLAIVTWVAANPSDGDSIEGTGGARKLRFAGKGRGKSGGYRVITFYSGAKHSGVSFECVFEERKDRPAPEGSPGIEGNPGEVGYHV